MHKKKYHNEENFVAHVEEVRNVYEVFIFKSYSK